MLYLATALHWQVKIKAEAVAAEQNRLNAATLAQAVTGKSKKALDEREQLKYVWSTDDVLQKLMIRLKNTSGDDDEEAAAAEPAAAAAAGSVAAAGGVPVVSGPQAGLKTPAVPKQRGGNRRRRNSTPAAAQVAVATTPATAPGAPEGRTDGSSAGKCADELSILLPALCTCGINPGITDFWRCSLPDVWRTVPALLQPPHQFYSSRNLEA